MLSLNCIVISFFTHFLIMLIVSFISLVCFYFQQKHQKQQAFEAELAANADRIATLITAGQNLIDSSKCSGGEVCIYYFLPKVKPLSCSLP